MITFGFIVSSLVQLKNSDTKLMRDFDERIELTKIKLKMQNKESIEEMKQKQAVDAEAPNALAPPDQGSNPMQKILVQSRYQEAANNVINKMEEDN